MAFDVDDVDDVYQYTGSVELDANDFVQVRSGRSRVGDGETRRGEDENEDDPSDAEKLRRKRVAFLNSSGGVGEYGLLTGKAVGYWECDA